MVNNKQRRQTQRRQYREQYAAKIPGASSAAFVLGSSLLVGGVIVIVLALVFGSILLGLLVGALFSPITWILALLLVAVFRPQASSVLAFAVMAGVIIWVIPLIPIFTGIGTIPIIGWFISGLTVVVSLPALAVDVIASWLAISAVALIRAGLVD